MNFLLAQAERRKHEAAVRRALGASRWHLVLQSLTSAMLVSLLQPRRAKTSTIDLTNIDYSTSWSFNIASAVVVAVLVGLYYTFW